MEKLVVRRRRVCSQGALLNFSRENSLFQALGKIIATVFVGEFVVMTALRYSPFQLSVVQEGLLHATLLSAVWSVVLWLIVVRPMKAQSATEAEKFNQLVEAVPDGVIGVDDKGRIRFLNERVLALFQYSRDELIGRPIEMLIPDRFAESHLAHRSKFGRNLCLRAMGAGLDLVGRRADGSEVPVEISLNHVDTPRGLLVICAVRDVSEQRRAHEALLVANRKLNRSVRDLERSSEELRRLSELGELLQGCITEHEAHTIISRVIARQLPGISGGVYLISASRNILQLTSSWGSQAGTLVPVLTTDDCWALRRGRMHTAQDMESTFQCNHMNPEHDGYFCIPMSAQGELLGVLHVFVPACCGEALGENHRITLESKRTLLLAISEQIGLALANLRLREELKRQSIRDSLTGLYNRRSMEESLDRETLRAAQTECTLSVTMIDLDHFKRFNDSFGHVGGGSGATGDRCFTSAAELRRRSRLSARR